MMNEEKQPAGELGSNAGLGPLPEPRTLSRGDEDGAIQLGYTADQMRAYAAQQVAAERERILSRCQGKTHDGCAYLGRCGMVCNKCGQVA
jgi:hypothetical protein